MNDTFQKKLDSYVIKGEFSTALSLLDEAINKNPDDDTLYVTRGKLHWRIGNHSRAMTDYSTALHLNPDSPAKHLLEMAQNVADFFNPDLLNP